MRCWSATAPRARYGAADTFDTGDADVMAPSSTQTTLAVALTPQDQGGVLGQVYDDLNANGALDAGENGVAPATVYADLNNNGQLDPGEPSAAVATTAPVGGNTPTVFGEYDLDHLAPGTYTLRTVLPAGWSQTTAPITATVTAGLDADMQNFGAAFPNQAKSYASPNVPVSIPAAPRNGSKTVSSTLAVADTYPILSLQVTVSATGAAGASYKLVAPDGTSYGVAPGTTRLDVPLFQHNIHGTWTLQISTNSGSQAGTLTAWSLSAVGELVPTIGTFTGSPNPVTVASPLTLSAGGVQDLYPGGGGIASVGFYQDANGDGQLEVGVDTFLGYGTNNAGTYSLTLNAPSVAGTDTYFALATDGIGVTGVPAAATVTVKAKK